MGDVHNELRRGPLGVALSNAVGDTRGGGLERYGETLTPVIDLWSQPEFSYLRTERLAAIALTQALVAGEFGAIALVNPAGSNAIAVVEAVSFDIATALIFQAQLATEAAIAATLAVGGSGTIRDRRWITNQITQATTYCRMYQGSDAASSIGLLTEQRRGAANSTTNFVETMPVVLAPGHGLLVVCLTIATAFAANFRWRERLAFHGELNT